MNRYSAYSQPVPGGWRVMLRFSKDGHPKPVMGEGDKPEVFPSELLAQQAITKHLLAYFNGDYQRCGERLSTAKSEAEKMWGAIHMNGREIKIERKAVKA
ncbi:hypothetical protein FHS21_001312 [Phyllobacterium trifolii]|uniref:Uncharacterized protein n=1 Tax=Phyllobacterium trifolii TaxID=300193 RepID=A0A839U868_9HYPH|nr:hypothetical protein [Phyllobacterium trifolii]MBB3144911.1 hypothetical protein [Phyllobacterium trifolii]